MRHRVRAGLLVASLLLSGCAPEHAHRTGILEFTPDHGYMWAEPNHARTVWASGMRYNDQPHMSSATQEGLWNADPGYTFSEPGKLVVHWTSGLAHPSAGHVLSGDPESTWMPEDGYQWKYPSGRSLETVWLPGLASRLHAHIVTAAEEGYWNAEPGYAFDRPSELQASWRPGIRHSKVAHVTAGEAEGSWVPDSGFHFERRDGQYVVVQNDIGEAVAQAFVAAIFDSCAKETPDDGVVVQTLVRDPCRDKRDEHLVNAARAVGLVPPPR